MAVCVTTRLAIAALAVNMFLGFTVGASQGQVLAPASQIEITVLDESGAVVPDCEIAFVSNFERIVSRTGPDGSATVKLRDGKYNLRTSKAGFVTNDVQFLAPVPAGLRIVLKVDRTPTDDPVVSDVPTTASNLPDAIETEPKPPLHMVGGPVALIRIVPRPSKNRSWRCLYLWKCSSGKTSER